MSSGWLVLCAALAAQQETRPLHVFDVDKAGLNAQTTGGVKLGWAQGAVTPEIMRRLKLAWDRDNTITVRWPVPAAVDAPVKEQSAASFLVDFDQPAVKTLVAAVEAKHGRNPGVDVLVAAVDEHIERKNGARVMDVASVVARRREGDCTEHAVLLTAVARAFGRPARMINGLAVVALPDGNVGAYGHAWTEIWEDGAWRVGDAALRRQKGTVHYVPVAVLVNEGMGFKAALMQLGDITELRKLVLVPRT